MRFKNGWILLLIILLGIFSTLYVANHYTDLLRADQWRYVIVSSLFINSFLVACVYAQYFFNMGLRRAVTEKTLQLDAKCDKLEKLSRTDGLTQLANRRYFDEYLEIEWYRARREKKSLSLVLIDVDYFKNYNDQYGHIEGDVCLQRIALSLRSCFIRSGDLVSRYDGECFAAVLPCTELSSSELIEKCRRVVKELNIEHAASPVGNTVTVSIGACTVVPSETLDVTDITKTADRALFRAKLEGRNRAVIFDFQRGKNNQGVVTSTVK